MTFDSLSFALSIIELRGLVAVSRGWEVHKLELLAASYLFSAAWNPTFIWLLLSCSSGVFGSRPPLRAS